MTTKLPTWAGPIVMILVTYIIWVMVDAIIFGDMMIWYFYIIPFLVISIVTILSNRNSEKE